MSDLCTYLVESTRLNLDFWASRFILLQLFRGALIRRSVCLISACF